MLTRELKKRKFLGYNVQVRFEDSSYQVRKVAFTGNSSVAGPGARGTEKSTRRAQTSRI